MKKVMIVVVAVLVAAAVAFFLLQSKNGEAEVKNVPENARVAEKARKGSTTLREVRRPAGKRSAVKSQKPVLALDDDDDEEDAKRTPAEKALAARIEKALDDEVLEDALACAGEALKCKDTAIRQAMVDTLGWFGAKAIPELTPFLADADDDVRESAMNEWSMAVSEIEDDAEKIGTVELAMTVLTDEDALEDISGEYIGVDDKLAVESLMRVIAADANKASVDKAKETYEFVTGDEWAGEEEAKRWIAEEYEP